MPNVPKDYKMTEVGVIPEDWDVRKLGELSTFRTGPFGSALHKSDYTDDGVPLVNPMHIIDGKLVPNTAMTVSQAAAKNLADFQLKADNIIMGRRGDMGRCAVVQSHQAGWLCGTGSIMIRCSINIDSHFIQRVLSSPKVVAAIEDTSVGSTMINLNQSTLAGLRIQCPPLSEQQAIAGTLGDADALIESLERLIAKKRQIKQGAMQELLTGKRRLPGFSGAWEVKRLGDLFSFSGGFTASRDQLTHDGYCYLHYGDIHTSAKTFIDVNAERSGIPKLQVPLSKVAPTSLLDDGDVVFVDASEDDEGTSKHIVVVNPDGVPFISGLHTIVAKARTDELDHGYLRHCFQTTAIKKQFLFYAVGTKVSGISKSNIAKVTMPVPSVTEQSAIAEILSDMDAEIEALELKLAKALLVKQGMMQELLTGRIRLV